MSRRGLRISMVVLATFFAVVFGGRVEAFGVKKPAPAATPAVNAAPAPAPAAPAPTAAPAKPPAPAAAPAAPKPDSPPAPVSKKAPAAAQPAAAKPALAPVASAASLDYLRKLAEALELK